MLREEISRIKQINYKTQLKTNKIKEDEPVIREPEILLILIGYPVQDEIKYGHL